MAKVLVTGAAGFIGMHVAISLARQGFTVVGIDNLNTYYSVDLKLARLRQQGISTSNIQYDRLLEGNENLYFVQIDVADANPLKKLFKKHQFDFVVHLAAQAGVRYSLEDPEVYIQANLVGFANILESCRHNKIKHLVYASSSSVYGLNSNLPLSTAQNVDHPISLYAATKKSNELMAHTYSHLFGIPTTGLRFFTVYGPWGRPDMAMFLFTDAIFAGRPLDVYNNGNMSRDFTYIDDIAEGVVTALGSVPEPNPDWKRDSGDPSRSSAPFRLFNIGNHQPVQLLHFIREIEAAIGKEAKLNFKPIQDGDVLDTYADVSPLYQELGFKPKVKISDGVRNFVDWFREYYDVS